MITKPSRRWRRWELMALLGRDSDGALLMIHKQRWFPPPDYVEQVYGYCRVSHTKQVEGNSLDDQQARITAYVTMQKLEEHGPFEHAQWCRFFLEPTAQSAFKKPLKQRPAGEELYEDLRPGDHVVIDKIDRMFRSPADFYEVDRHFTENGVSLHVVNMGGNAINTANAYGRFMLGMFVGVAEMESAIRGERVRDARARLRARKLDAGVSVPFWVALEGLPVGRKRASGSTRVWQPWGQAALEKIKYFRDVEQMSWYKLCKCCQSDHHLKGRGQGSLEYAYWFYCAWLEAKCPDLNELKISEFTEAYKQRRFDKCHIAPNLGS